MIGRGLLALTCVCLVFAAGCGGDDEDAATTGADTTPTETQTVTEALTETETIETETEIQTDTTQTQASTSPEDQPGGAGDEEPARSQALFTGKGGRITPPVVKVPPFIAIRVELRSADGKGYSLDFGNGKGVMTSQQISSSSTQFPGLRPNRKLVGRPLGGIGNVVTIVASAEPGP